MKRIKMTGFFAIIILLASCSSTKITSSWKATGATISHYDKVLVVGLLPPKYRNAQADMENRMVKDLKKNGVNATSAFAEFGPKAFNNKNEEKMLASLRDKGYNAAITITLQDKSSEKYRSAGSVTYQPVAVYRNRFSGYYSTVYNRYYTPGYTSTETNYLWETNMYDLKTDAMLYSVQSKSFNPSSAESIGKQYSKNIVKDMEKKGLITKS